MKKRIVAVAMSAMLLLCNINVVSFAYDGAVEVSDAVFYTDGEISDYYEAGSLKAVLNAKNNSNKEQKIMLVGALYSDDGRSTELTAVESELVTLSAGETKSGISLEGLSSSDSEGIFKVYAFYRDNLSPIRDAQTLTDYDSAVDKALEGFDEVFGEEMLDWLASLYHYESGGFYYSRSARDYEGFAPDIESSSQAYDILVGLDVIEGGADYSVPDYFREKNIEFMKTRQAEDGYFYDPQFGTDIGSSKKHRNFNQAYGALKRYNITPTYPLPSEYSTKSRIALMSTGELHLSSPEALRSWMENLFASYDAYTAGNAIASSSTAITNSPELTAEALSYLKEKQSPNGFWYGKGETEGEINYAAVNGAMKISGIFKESAEPYPNVESMIDGTIGVILSNDIPDIITSVWNPLVLITHARGSYSSFPQICADKLKKNMVDIIGQSIYKIKAFKQSDGGFSYNRYHSSPTSQGAYVGLGLAEGDINSTYMGTQGMMSSCYSLAGKQDEIPSFAHYKERFFEKLLSEENRNYPKLPAQNFNDDFEADSIDGWSINSSAAENGGKIELLTDPKDSSNKAMKITTDSDTANTATTVSHSLLIPANIDELDFSCSFMLCDYKSGEGFINSVGQTAAQWLIRPTSGGSSLSLSNRSGESGYGTVFKTNLSANTWHKLRLVYRPSDSTGSKISYYIDDEPVYSTDEYYGYASGTPTDNLKSISFSSFISTESSLWLDDISVITN